MGEQSKELIARIVAAPVHVVGTVRGCDSGRHRVQTEFGDLDAGRAASCLLVPEDGDVVLVSGPRIESVWIIAVLERHGVGPARLDIEGDASLSAGGSLRLDAGADLGLKAGRCVGLQGEELEIHAVRGRSVIDSFEAFGRELAASVSRLRLTGGLFEVMAERLTSFLGHSVRTVEGVDQARSGVVDYRAEKSMSLRGRDLIATAENLVRVDGSQINIG